jgi:hypothetical protein
MSGITANQKQVLNQIYASAQLQASTIAQTSVEAAFKRLPADASPAGSRVRWGVLTPVEIAGLLAMAAQDTAPPPPPVPTQIGPLQASLNFPGDTPVGGSASLALFQDGTYAFNGNFHDSGAPSYNLDFAWVIVSASGRAYSFTKQGHMAGTFESGSRDCLWTAQGTNADLAANWGDLTMGYHWRCTAGVNWDVQAAVDAVVNALKVAGTVISAVVAVVALV